MGKIASWARLNVKVWDPRREPLHSGWRVPIARGIEKVDIAIAFHSRSRSLEVDLRGCLGVIRRIKSQTNCSKEPIQREDFVSWIRTGLLSNSIENERSSNSLGILGFEGSVSHDIYVKDHMS